MFSVHFHDFQDKNYKKCKQKIFQDLMLYIKFSSYIIIIILLFIHSFTCLLIKTIRFSNDTKSLFINHTKQKLIMIINNFFFWQKQNNYKIPL